MIYVLMNPKANNGEGEKDAREWAKCLNGKTTFINVLETEDMKGFLSSLNEEDEIVVSGGDGTVHHFANNAVELGLKNKMYYVKSGSGNDFYRDNKEYVDDLGRIPLNKFLENLPVVTVNGIKKRFLNGAAFGLDGETCKVGEEIRATTTKKINYTSIAIKLLLGKFKLKNATVTVDGVTKYYKHVWLATTMKGKYYGGGMKAAPSQDRFDEEGKVSFVCLHKRSRIGTLLVFPTYSKGEHEGKKWADVITGKKIEVKFDKPCAIQIDGEVIDNVTSYTVEVPTK